MFHSMPRGTSKEDVVNFHLPKTVWENIEKRQNSDPSKLSHFYGTPFSKIWAKTRSQARKLFVQIFWTFFTVAERGQTCFLHEIAILFEIPILISKITISFWKIEFSFKILISFCKTSISFCKISFLFSNRDFLLRPTSDLLDLLKTNIR